MISWRVVRSRLGVSKFDSPLRTSTLGGRRGVFRSGRRDIFQLYNAELANAIRSEGAQHAWNNSNKFVQGHLDFQSAFWHTFFSYSLFPSYHHHTVTLGPAILLY